MPLSRRTNKVEGFVDFPVDSKEWVSSGEGGLAVFLVVEDYSAEGWPVCCTGYASLDQCECYQGSDTEKPYEFFYPSADNPDSLPFADRYGSVGYLAVMMLGTTGWSGWNGERHWICTYEDLTKQGKNLYDSVKRLYGEHATLHLQTWLDT